MSDIRIDNTNNILPPANVLINSRGIEEDDIQIKEIPILPRPPGPTPEGIRTPQQWNEWLDYIMALVGKLCPFEFQLYFIPELKAFIQSCWDKGQTLDYSQIIGLIQGQIDKYSNEFGTPNGHVKAVTDAILEQLAIEQKNWGEYIKSESARKAMEIENLRAQLEALLSSASPSERAKILKFIEKLDKQLALLDFLLKQPSSMDLFKLFSENEKDLNLAINDAIALINELGNRDPSEPSDPTPPNNDIPLEEGESVRNQRRKSTHGIGVGSGASHYLKAFYGFSQTCNKLITMNAAWGMELSNLQRDASKLSISCQNAMNQLMADEMADFKEGETPSKIGIIQSKLAALQSDFTAYQKTLETVMPLVLEQPKNITKDLDKFLEAAKSILQLLTTYANFRI
jgi:hypothetical protein